MTAHPERASVVALGDSIASGEGIDYGYTYDAASGRWVGGVDDPRWAGPYQACHVSAQAYGGVVAAGVGGNFENFACTGSTYTNGVVGPRVANNKVLRPAQFGDWAHRRMLNPAYDAARPSLVLITLGADSTQFVRIVEACVADSVIDPRACTAADPGPTIVRDLFGVLPQLGSQYRDLVASIEERGRHDGRVPLVVLTTYPDPLPPPGADISLLRCPDAAHLNAGQIAYLSSLLGRLDDTIVAAVAGVHGAVVADVRDAFDGHRFCSVDPWAYGPSLLAFANPASQAPFHPTPAGQRVIAAAVLAKLGVRRS